MKMDNGAGNSNLEIIIDRILVSAQDLKKKLDIVKEHSSNEGNDVIEQKVANEFISNQKIKELERENTELRQALEDHQYGLEFIMSKYRSQVVELIKLNKIERNVTPPDTLPLKRNNSVE